MSWAATDLPCIFVFKYTDLTQFETKFKYKPIPRSVAEQGPSDGFIRAEAARAPAVMNSGKYYKALECLKQCIPCHGTITMTVWKGYLSIWAGLLDISQLKPTPPDKHFTPQCAWTGAQLMRSTHRHEVL